MALNESGVGKIRIVQPIGDAVSQKRCKIGMKIDPYYRRQKCRPMSLVSGGIRLMRIFADVRWGGASNDSGVVDNGNLPSSLTSSIIITNLGAAMRHSSLKNLKFKVERRTVFCSLLIILSYIAIILLVLFYS